MEIRSIKPGEVFSLVCPRIEELMCGVYKAGFFPDGRIVLVYSDESREEATFSPDEAQELIDKGETSIFPIVGAVQDRARRNKQD